jgi:2-dehydropantoate 2-reductase
MPSKFVKQWEKGRKTISLSLKPGVEEAHGGFDVETTRPPWRRHGKQVTAEAWAEPMWKPHYDAATPGGMAEYDVPADAETGHIHNLIVTIKASQTVGALLPLRHRLTADSTVLFLQDSMGILEQISEEVFPDKEKRPNYMLGNNSHRVAEMHYGPMNFKVIYSHAGTLSLSLLPRTSSGPLDEAAFHSKDPWAPSSHYLLRTLLRSPRLVATAASPTEMHLSQLEKVAIHSIIQPLTALLDGTNASLLYNFSLTRVMRLLLAETSLVLRSLPEIKMHPNTADRFAADRLETLVVDTAHRTGKLISPMLSETRHGLRTDIQYINGYIVKRGEELGIRCYMNYLIMQLVKGKQNMVDREHNEQLPLFVVPGDKGKEQDEDVGW